MQCPYCSHAESRVIDSRQVGNAIRRRRQCLGCGERFTTYERAHNASILIVKKDGRREEYSRDKLIASIRGACGKRPLPTGAIEGMADDIEVALNRMGRAEISSRTVGDMVMERLRELDPVAYIRFASLCRQFRDIADLRRELEALSPARQSRPGTPDSQLPLIP